VNSRRLAPSLIALLLPLSLRAAVEDGAPPPLPQSEGVAPVEAPAADPVAPARRARRAGVVRDDAPGPFGASIALSGGYDSNIVLLDDEAIATLDTEEDGAAIGIDVKGVWRAVNRPDARLNVTLDGELDEYPDQDDRQLARFGVIVSGLTKWNGGWSPGGSIGAHRYLLDGEDAADVFTATATCSRISADWVAIPAVEVYAIEYDELDEASGVLAAARYRHWFLLQPNDSRKRIEAGLRAGAYEADSDAWSYVTVRPELGVSYRIGAKPQLGTWDLNLRGHLDWREYGDGEVAGDEIGTELLTNIGADVAYWTCRWSALGLYVEYTVRDSDRVDRDYDRWQAGGRISAAW